jgi:cytochrome d ubiquinol oxidase subunit II
MVATIAAGRLAHGASGAAWISPFSIACGTLSLALAAFLAATYLTVEVTDVDLREDFRRRALGAGAAAGVVASVAFVLSRTEAPLIYAGLGGHLPAAPGRGTWPLHLVTGATAAGALAALWWRRFQLARALAALQVALVICGWAVSQYPFLVPPTLTLWTDAAPARTRTLLLMVLAAGLPVLVPSLVVLYRVFKRPPSRPGAPPLRDGQGRGPEPS